MTMEIGRPRDPRIDTAVLRATVDLLGATGYAELSVDAIARRAGTSNANLDRVISFMRALKARGCRFSLDDFGTGMSSLTYLKNLPVDYVKIDGQFVRNVLRDGADECVVESIARMARAFKIQAIAERVESRDVMKRLGELGVAFAQGYFIAVPQPVSDLPVRPNAPHPRLALRLSAGLA